MPDPSALNTASTAPASESFLQEVEGKIAEFGEDVVLSVETFVKNFDTKYAPYIKAFLLALLQQEGKNALDAAILAAPTGNAATVAASVGAAVAGTLAANAYADAETEVKQAQADQLAASATAAAAGTTTGDQAAAEALDQAADSSK